MIRNKFHLILLVLLVIGSITACDGQTLEPDDTNGLAEDRLKIVATTTLVGDVVSRVGGDQVDLSILLPVGTDPHSFDPTPQDIALISDADIVFANGAGLEGFLDPLIVSAGAANKIVHVSENIDFLRFSGEEQDHKDEEHNGVDPHTWTDPNNVKVWVSQIENQLREMDPDNADIYEANANAYVIELENLDAWIRNQVDQIPLENRMLVTDHALFRYFADEYGFEQIGALIPSFSTLAEPTAQELATIENAIREMNVRAIFVGNTVNPNLAERIAEDTGTKLVFVYTGSLSESEGEAPTYLDYMRYNTNAFVDALK